MTEFSLPVVFLPPSSFQHAGLRLKIIHLARWALAEGPMISRASLKPQIWGSRYNFEDALLGMVEQQLIKKRFEDKPFTIGGVCTHGLNFNFLAM